MSLRSWLARRLGLHPPLRDMRWSGAALQLGVACADGTPVALELDGCFFDVAPVTGGTVRFPFPVSPSGSAVLGLLPRLGREGPPLLARPVGVRLGRSGLVRPAARPALAPLAAGARVPAGVDAAAAPVAVVVPVFNAPELVARCLDSVLAHTTGRARLIVVDDASTDPAIAPLLAGYGRLQGVEILSNARNLGFTASANRGMRAAGTADVVLLNSDAEVGACWLQGLRHAVHSAPDVASATAVSDQAGAFSVPELERENPLPAGWDTAHAARTLWQGAGTAYPVLPTGNGFCMYLRRAALDAVGLFDEAAFPQGYGEENDWSQRAAAAGWRHLVAGNVFVRHAGSASFGNARRIRLGAAGMEVLRARWPDYEAEVGRSLFSFERRLLDWRVRRLWAMALTPRPRVLGLDAGAWSDAPRWTLAKRAGRERLLAGRRTVAAAPRDEPAAQRPARLQAWLQEFAIEAVLAGVDDDPPLTAAARRLGLPVLAAPAGDFPSAAAARAAAVAATRAFGSH